MNFKIFGLIIGLCVGLSGYARSENKVELPKIYPGDSWTYSRKSKYDITRTSIFVVTVSSFTATGFKTFKKVIEGSDKSCKNEFTNELNPIKKGRTSLKPYIPKFSFPLTPGKTWEGKWKYTVRPGPKTLNFNATMKSRVEGWETIKTQAGEFSALKITFEADHINQYGRGAYTKGSQWYSPKVRNIVRSEIIDKGGRVRHEVTELIDYNPAH